MNSFRKASSNPSTVARHLEIFSSDTISLWRQTFQLGVKISSILNIAGLNLAPKSGWVYYIVRQKFFFSSVGLPQQRAIGLLTKHLPVIR